jgi:hypothetical protein
LIGAAVLIPAVLPGISPSPLLAEFGGAPSCGFRWISAEKLHFCMVYSREGGIK